MNDNPIHQRIKGRTLLIVEGNHEKCLFYQVLQCFPELHINHDSIVIYETNIYTLCKVIEKEYGEGWEKEDIDLPFLVSKQKSDELLDKLYKRDFTNIFLLFDYERQAPSFSERSIEKMQECFTDETDNGKLYLNYPMVESYLDINIDMQSPSLDPDYSDKTASANISKGAIYKNKFQNSRLHNFFHFQERVTRQLTQYAEIIDEKELEECVRLILNVCDDREARLLQLIQRYAPEKKARTRAINYSKELNSWLPTGASYLSHMRTIIKCIIRNNIIKALFIQTKSNEHSFSECEKEYDTILFSDILKKQNNASRDLCNGFIWVLNTCLFIVVEYNKNLLN